MKSLIIQYFLNDRLDPDEITRQMEEFAAAGYQGVYPHARAGLTTPYMSEDWWRAIDVILEACHRTGLECWIWDEDYYPSGLAGGRIVWEDPGLIARGIEFTVEEVEGEGPFEVDFGPGHLLRAFAIAREASGAMGDPIDVTHCCGTRRQRWTSRHVVHWAYSPLIHPIGHPHWRTSFVDNAWAVSWTPPAAGAYVVVAARVCASGGVHPDMLRPESVERFLQLSHAKYWQRYKEEFGQTIMAAFTDEPSPGFLFPWTRSFPIEFESEHGYDILENLAHLAVDIDERSATIRHHYRLTQGRLQRRCYVDAIAKWCEHHNIAMTGHLTRTEWLSLTAAWWPNELRCYRSMHIPTADPLGASAGWTAAAAYHTGLKVASSAAHLFGRAQASTDALAVVGEEARLRDLKYQLDYQMVLGINHFSLHGASYSFAGPRKDEVPPSLSMQHSEWKYMPVLLDHVRRTCEALTGGRHACELALLYPSTSLACQLGAGTSHPNLPDEVPIHNLVELLLSHQCDFDFIDEITLAESVDESGQLHTPESYRTIILPHLRYIDAGAAEALLRFARASGQVLVVGSFPLSVPRKLGAPVPDWDDGIIPRLTEVESELLHSLRIANVNGDGATDVFALRRLDGEELRIFLFNRREQAFTGTVDSVPVEIAPHGSLMLSSDDHDPAPTRPSGPATDLSSGWQITFESNQLPLSFWHVEAPAGSGRAYGGPFSNPAFDLMTRQPDPAADGDGPVRYLCRFMLTGDVPDARIFADTAAVTGEWTLQVNDCPIEGWRSQRELGGNHIAADVGFALRSGSTPTLNVVSVTTSGPGRELHEVLYLLGWFTCEYRYSHFSYPFLQSRQAELPLDVLQSWDVLGHPTFSGSATYTRQFDIAAAGDYILDLGRVEDIAAVHIDGEQVAVLAWPPYRCALPDVAVGNHSLSVTVTNAPANRTRAARLPAGLLGPVRLYQTA